MNPPSRDRNHPRDTVDDAVSELDRENRAAMERDAIARLAAGIREGCFAPLDDEDEPALKRCGDGSCD